MFTTIAVSDGISMGHEGMRASLVSREVIADSVELVMHAERFDALVAIAGCDKSLPGMMMAAARLDLPAVFLYGGSSLPGHYQGRDISIIDVFEGIGAEFEGPDHRRGPDGDRARSLSRCRLVRRDVHRQHDGLGRGGARALVARVGLGARGRSPAPRFRPAVAGKR